jgi:hypothetical protein
MSGWAEDPYNVFMLTLGANVFALGLVCLVLYHVVRIPAILVSYVWHRDWEALLNAGIGAGLIASIVLAPIGWIVGVALLGKYVSPWAAGTLLVGLPIAGGVALSIWNERRNA